MVAGARDAHVELHGLLGADEPDVGVVFGVEGARAPGHPHGVREALRAARPHLFGSYTLQAPAPAAPEEDPTEPLIDADEGELQEIEMEGAEEQDILADPPPGVGGDGAVAEDEHLGEVDAQPVRS